MGYKYACWRDIWHSEDGGSRWNTHPSLTLTVVLSLLHCLTTNYMRTACYLWTHFLEKRQCIPLRSTTEYSFFHFQEVHTSSSVSCSWCNWSFCTWEDRANVGSKLIKEKHLSYWADFQLIKRSAVTLTRKLIHFIQMFKLNKCFLSKYEVS